MSRAAAGVLCFLVYVPRASGDEPSGKESQIAIVECSPRERG